MSAGAERHERLASELESHDLLSWLDLSVVEMERGRVVFALPFDEKFANIASGTVHGGITATVIDTASGFALRTTFDSPREAALTTTDLNTRYVRPATDDLRVEAEVVRAGRTMGVTECEVTSVHEGNGRSSPPAGRPTGCSGRRTATTTRRA
ncbi:PaaI family thioesterase [Halosegnis marinus]|uniref:PaaI family thioesterase n=1 Tax=Halosegnis marinus TaxID=3034023 RepID=UPI00362033A9